METKRKHEHAFEDRRASWFMIGAGALVILSALYAGTFQTSAAVAEIESEPLASVPVVEVPFTDELLEEEYLSDIGA